MFFPNFSSRIKKQNFRLCSFVKSSRKIGFIKIAGTARQSRIFQNTFAASCLRNDMFNLKRQIKNPFGGVTIFANMKRARRNRRIIPVHGNNPPVNFSARFVAARSSNSIKFSNSIFSSGFSPFSAFRFINSVKRFC